MKQGRWRRVAAVAAVLAMLLPGLVCAQAQNQDEAVQAAIYLLRSAMSPTPDGQSVQLLRALRQMGDPALQPYFSQLYQSSSPVLKIHGILGLAECCPEKQLDLGRLNMLTDKDSIPVQVEMVNAAMDSDVLSDDQARQLIDSKGTDVAIKVLVSAPLIKSKTLPTLDHLKEAAKSDIIVRKIVALVMLIQCGDPTAYKRLEELDHSDDPKRDKGREMALERALRYEFDATGPWALHISNEPDVTPRVGLLGLRVALRFNAPGAVAAWQKQFESSNDAVTRMRLALLALQLSPWMPADFFQPLVNSSDPLIKQMGVTSVAVANHKDVAPAITALIKMYHPIANNWALTYAHKEATPSDAKTIYLTLIRAADEGGEANRSQRLDDALLATQMLYEADPAEAVKVLRPLLTDSKTSLFLQQSILVGLIATKTPGAEQVVSGITFNDMDTSHLALLLLAKPAKPLTPLQMEDFSMLVRGGGGLPQTLRMQAAWTYLKITHKTKEALAEVLANAP